MTGKSLNDQLVRDILQYCKYTPIDPQNKRWSVNELLLGVNRVCVEHGNPGMTHSGLRSFLYEARRWHKILGFMEPDGVELCCSLLEWHRHQLKKRRAKDHCSA